MYLWDEDRDWIPLAKSISFSPEALNLPVRGYHPALAAYGIALGRAVFGPSEVGSRIVGVLLGALTIVVVFDLTRRWASQTAAIGAALLLAFNEYHIQVSALATEKVYYLFFASLALWAFSRFLLEERAVWLYASAVALAASFLSKELAILLLPAFFLSLLLTARREWLRRRDPYLAALFFWLLILPDLWWNASHRPSEIGIDYRTSLSRIQGLQLSYQSLVLYLRGPIEWITAQLGHPFKNAVSEYATPNLAFGVFLLMAVATTTVRPPALDRSTTRSLLIVFFVVLVFFSVLETRGSHDLDSYAFFWVDLTLLPAAVIGGSVLASGSVPRKWATWGVCIVGVVASLTATVRDHLGMSAYQLAADPPALVATRDTVYSVRMQANACVLCDQQAAIRLREVQPCAGRENAHDDMPTELGPPPRRGAGLDEPLLLAGTRAMAAAERSYCVTYGVETEHGHVPDIMVEIPVVSAERGRRAGANPRVLFPSASW